MSEEKTIEAGNSLPQPLGSAAFSVWSEARGVWPRLTHEEIFRAGWDAAIAAATAHVKDQALTTDEIAACSLWKRINQKLSNKDVSDERD